MTKTAAEIIKGKRTGANLGQLRGPGLAAYTGRSFVLVSRNRNGRIVVQPATLMDNVFVDPATELEEVK